ncbi:MAG: hypothetical protein MUO22_00585 [Sedimentisphaerales bacterium]|nr:hypothetical protein [Sedimentisphaerales bacterium]
MVTGRERRWVLPALLVLGLFFWVTQLEIGYNTAAGQGSAREDGTLLTAVQRGGGIEGLVPGQADKGITDKTLSGRNKGKDIYAN